MTHKILFIDDEKNVLTAVQRQLRRDFDLVTAVGGAEAIAKLRSDGPFAVAVCDMRMPDMDGVTTLAEINRLSPDTTRLMLTGNADQQTAVDAINQGQIFRFLNKPCPDDILRSALKDALRQHELVTAEKTLLQHTLAGSVKVLMDVLSMIDPDAFGQATQVRQWSRKVAKALKLKSTWDLDMAATLMPLGLVAVPPDIVAKQRSGKRLSTVEQEVFDAAPGTAHRLIANIPRLSGVADMVYYQSKSFSGEGYPFNENVAGKTIPYGARILKVLGDLAKETGGADPRPTDILKLEDQADQYDPKVLQVVVDLWGSSSGAANGPKGIRKDVTVSLLLAGDRLISDIRLKNGNLLLSSGNAITDAHIERVKSLKNLSGIIEPITIERMKI
ncbi:MAG: response regulator [Rhodospirillaceae bacterium]